ncbi:hypothetical protein [Flavobacterium hydrophilum]|uniref:Uncharacterized protein n=1 Tax=Flavobacterium hydrophilum TaxID=2211445 RepID=A0A2V4C9D7_9FLAO|nr:hypothetical protein [Flavobacterium hydrophilum]PXY47182.1 hypothetical protein DMB68_08560 [Flavobacterium hydrophilum]
MKDLFLIIVFFITTICISQNVKVDSVKQFTTNEIDSICKINGKEYISEGKIIPKMGSKSKKNKIVKNGNGSFSYSFYINHLNKEKYNSLSNKNSELIKVCYKEKISYKSSLCEVIDAQFYYSNDSLNYIKLKLIRTENKKDTSGEFNISISELNETKAIRNDMLFDYKHWIIKKNEEIIKIYNNK